MTNIEREIKNRFLGLRTHQFLSHWLLSLFAQLCSVFLDHTENHMGFNTRPSTPIHEKNNPNMQRSTGWVSFLMGWESSDIK